MRLTHENIRLFSKLFVSSYKESCHEGSKISLFPSLCPSYLNSFMTEAVIGRIKGLQIGSGFRDYKSGQEGITNRVSLRDSKLGQKDYKSEQERLQTGAGITNRCRTFSSINLMNFTLCIIK